jgi:TetR/AcrR family transcriptional regulator, regulator of cefoperazone and chloramphenicol sensitivity
MHTLTHDKVLDETRARIIGAAGEVFAETGFDKATVREICARAQANIAAVNYHFRDKLGLYSEVLKTAACNGRADVDEAQALADPERALGHFIHGMFRRMHQADRPSWYARVMLHELAQPTDALDMVIEQMIRPNSRILCAIVGKILDRPPDDETTRLSAASVIAQVVHHVHAKPVIQKLWPGLKSSPEAQEMIANHITEFSLAALHALRRKNAPAKHSARRSK